mgnify:FL=1
MLRYPESNLEGKIVSARRHAAIPTVTILRVCVEDLGSGEQETHIFDNLIPPQDLEGLHLRADALFFPPAQNFPDEKHSILAMEWCLYDEHGKTVKCSPGWSEHDSAPEIQIKPLQN